MTAAGVSCLAQRGSVDGLSLHGMNLLGCKE
jgi:hypothetical protein